MSEKRKVIGEALAELVEQARSGGPKLRVGLMAAGSEHGSDEILRGALDAMAMDPRLEVVALGPRVPGYESMNWIECPEDGAQIGKAMESALAEGRIAAAVAMHYPFPVGVSTVGRVLTPGRGRPMLVASCTGTSAIHRNEAMLRNAVFGVAVARTLGIEAPTVGILNLEGGVVVERALRRMIERGYAPRFGSSVRADGGALLRGNDLLAGTVDVCVCDTFTGNVLIKLFSAFGTGGGYESVGWGYGPSVGENWPWIVSIISRASGAPVIANALQFTAAMARGNLPARVAGELSAARAAGFDEALSSVTPAPVAGAEETVSAPPREPVDCEIHGLDVLAVEDAVKALWKAGVYAESSMGCTGPVVKVAARELLRSEEMLRAAGYL